MSQFTNNGKHRSTGHQPANAAIKLYGLQNHAMECCLKSGTFELLQWKMPEESGLMQWWGIYSCKNYFNCIVYLRAIVIIKTFYSSALFHYDTYLGLNVLNVRLPLVQLSAKERLCRQLTMESILGESAVRCLHLSRALMQPVHRQLGCPAQRSSAQKWESR